MKRSNSRSVRKALGLQLLKGLHQFIGGSQAECTKECLAGEEQEFFIEKLAEITGIVHAMPKTYEAEGQGDKAVVHLRYFAGGSASWWITEKDMDTDGTGQLQAFGLADLGHGEPELGYISIAEIIANGGELDFHWTPKTLGEVKEKIAA